MRETMLGAQQQQANLIGLPTFFFSLFFFFFSLVVAAASNSIWRSQNGGKREKRAIGSDGNDVQSN